MRLVIVDDEPLARERLARMVADLPGWEVVGEAGDGDTALGLIRSKEPDVVLLDIHMPGSDGLQVARALAGDALPPAVVFVTAHDEHALSAHETKAAGYLLKPIRREKLIDALRAARRPSRAQLQALETAPQQPHARRFVHATTRDGLLRVPVQEVVYFLADQKYTTVHHMHGQVLIEESLRSLEQDLGQRFVRVHRKVLAAARYMDALTHADDGSPMLRMRHAADLLPVSRRRVSDVRELLTKG